MTTAMLSTIKTCFEEKTGKELFFLFSIFLTMLVGVVFRSQGYFNGTMSLWLDEAEWVFKLSDRPLLENALFRPIGFVLTTRFLIGMVNNEVTLRFMSYAASVLSIPLIYLIAREVFTSKLTVFLAVFMVSFNPVLINFAKEFKPYSLELCLHMLLLYLLLQYLKCKTTRLFSLVLCMSFVMLFFAYNIVFLYPSLFLLVLSEAYQEHKMGRMLMSWAAVLLLAGLCYAFYAALWSQLHLENAKIYWGEKYDVFCLSSHASDCLQWMVHKYLLLVERSGTATILAHRVGVWVH